MNDLNDDRIKIEILRLKNEGLSYRKISNCLGIPKTTIGEFLRGETYSEWWAEYEDKPLISGYKYDHHSNITKTKNKRFILTSAQNNTFCNKDFLQSLQCMALYNNAQIIIGTFSYNKNGFQNLQKSDADWFDPLIADYIIDEPLQLADGLIWCGELNILPTADSPLSGLYGYTRSNSGIIPHVKVQMQSLPTTNKNDHKFLYTTGAVTLRNYITKKSGQKASFHHIFGALYVEVDDDGDWFVRQLSADDDGSFYDLDKKYNPDYTIESNQIIEAVNWGDLHSEKKDDVVYRVSFSDDDKSILNILKPRYQFISDTLDFTVRNHHNISDPYFRFECYITGKNKVVDNIKSVVDTLKMLDRDYSIVVVVRSNHDLAFDRWLKEADYKNDPENAIFFLEHQLAKYKSIEARDKNFNIFEYAVKKLNPDERAIFLNIDDGFKICNNNGDGIECGSHGHIGVNGSRGSVQGFTKLSAKYNIAHLHSATIKDGVYCCGVSGKLDMGYNQGSSTWSHSHVITYKNGKRSIITIKNGKWRV